MAENDILPGKEVCRKPLEQINKVNKKEKGPVTFTVSYFTMQSSKVLAKMVHLKFWFLFLLSIVMTLCTTITTFDFKQKKNELSIEETASEGKPK